MANPNTVSPVRPNISQGSSGNNVKACQQLLNLRNSAGLTVDGSFGSGTLAAVKAYQKKMNLTQDGVVGPATWNELDTVKEWTVDGYRVQLKCRKAYVWIKWGGSSNHVITLMKLTHPSSGASAVGYAIPAYGLSYKSYADGTNFLVTDALSHPGGSSSFRVVAEGDTVGGVVDKTVSVPNILY